MSKASHHCVLSCDSSGSQTQSKPGDTGNRNKVSLLCEFSGESSSVLTGRRILYNRSTSMESRHCGLLGVLGERFVTNGAGEELFSSMALVVGL